MSALRRTAITTFRRLPPGIRQRVVKAATPSYTLGAIVLLRDHDGRLLLLRQPPHTEWSLPGGLLDRRESPAKAAARELREEVGVRLEPGDLTAMTPNALVYPTARQVDLVFTATVDAGTTDVVADEIEVTDPTWHDVAALPPLTITTKRLLDTYGIGA